MINDVLLFFFPLCICISFIFVLIYNSCDGLFVSPFNPVLLLFFFSVRHFCVCALFFFSLVDAYDWVIYAEAMELFYFKKKKKERKDFAFERHMNFASG